MISGDAHVEYIDEAKTQIDPKNSYVIVIDQTPSHGQETNAAGDTFNFEKNVDAKWTFESLLKGRYVPYTFAEWLSTDPIESSKSEYSHTGETISIDDLFGSEITANYGIFDIYAYIYNNQNHADSLDETLNEELVDGEEEYLVNPPQEDGSYLISCSANLDDLFDRFSIRAVDIDSASISGWVMDQMGRLPVEGDHFVYENLDVTVTKLEHHRILEIRVAVIPEPEEE